MAAEKLLTEARCKTAKATDSVYYLNDGSGLRLRIRPDGSRSWLLRFFIQGKESTQSLGPYPQVSLQIARAKAAEAKQIVREGLNPVVEARVKRAAKVVESETTFGVVAQQWLDHNAGSWSPHHLERNEGLLRRFLLPDLARLPVDSIEEHYLFAVLKAAYDRGTKESARRARAVAAQVFSYARATHKGSRNPARDMADNPYFRKPPVKHFKALPQGDITSLMAALKLSGKDQKLAVETVAALKLSLYTGLRDHSVRGARWAEIDFLTLTWTIPGERMKSKRKHTVPLTKQAVGVLRELELLTYRGAESFLFPGKTQTGYMAENTMRQALHRLGFAVTHHGIRSLITDVLNENGFREDPIERQLDHQEKNQVRRAYLHSDFMEERRAMMQWFADWCDSPADAAALVNVIPLRRAS
jgi:integrase